VRILALMLSSAGAAFTVTGCAHGYVAYDPYWQDYHRWNPGEYWRYWDWTVEAHRPHVAYQRLPSRDQRAYWIWRHRR
jgi:hypothetical protein